MRVITTVCLIWLALSTWGIAQSLPKLNWQALPPIPNELGLAGPVVGVYDNLLIAGGGANFAKPVWENVKRWHRELYVLDLQSHPLAWRPTGNMPSPLAYAACVSTPHGVAVIGGNDEHHESAQCWLFRPQRHVDGKLTIERLSLPDLPRPLVYGQAVWIRDRLMVLTGQAGSELSSAMAGGWQLELTNQEVSKPRTWQPIEDCPGGVRAFAMASSVTGPGGSHKLLLMGGRRQAAGGVEFLNDVWQYDAIESKWRQLTSMPVAITAGAAGPIRAGVIAILSGDDGSLFTQTDKLKDSHPGFAKRTWLFDVSANRWHAGEPSPANQVTTPPVTLGDSLFIISGEVRPRVRTNQVWKIQAIQ